MEITEKDIKKITLVLLVVILGTLVFFILKPVVLSVIAGLVLAYIFMPVYNWTLKYIKYRTLTASLISILALAIIIIPLWFAVPIMIDQVFEVFQLSQNIDFQGFITSLLPKISEAMTTQIVLSLNSALNKLTSSILNGLVSFLLDLPKIALQIVIVAFVFFFTLRDKEQLKEFAIGLSPLNKNQEKSLIKQFRDITQTVIYGQIIVGLLQGIFAGIGFLIFGVDNALLLAVLAAIFSIIPLVGPSIVYLPIFLYMFVTTANPAAAIVFLIYNLVIVSSIDNLIRAKIVSMRTNISQVIILIGMIGGLFFFGVLGLLLGPLILAYFLTILRAYKEKNLSSLFASD